MGRGAKLTDDQVARIRKVHADEGLSTAQLAARFGLSKRQVLRLVAREQRKEVL